MRENPVRDAARASQIEDPSMLAAMPERVFEAAFAAACNARHVRIVQRRRSTKDFDGAVFVDRDQLNADTDALLHALLNAKSRRDATMPLLKAAADHREAPHVLTAIVADADRFGVQDAEPGLLAVAAALFDGAPLGDGDAAARGVAAYLDDRLCVPRDLGAPSAAALRKLLL